MGGLSSKVLIANAQKKQKKRLRNLETQIAHTGQTTDEQIQANIRKVELIKVQLLKRKQLETERLKQEQYEAEQIEQEQLSAQKIKQEQIENKQLNQKQLKAEQLKQDQLEAEQLKQEQLMARKLKQEQVETKLFKQYLLEQEQLEAKRLKEKQLEVERLKEKQLEVERLKEKQLEVERLKEKQHEAKRLKRDQLETLLKQLEIKRLKQRQLEVKLLMEKQLEAEQLKQNQLRNKQINQDQAERLKQYQLEAKQEQHEANQLEQSSKLAQKIKQEQIDVKLLIQKQPEAERLEEEQLVKGLKQEKIQGEIIKKQSQAADKKNQPQVQEFSEIGRYWTKSKQIHGERLKSEQTEAQRINKDQLVFKEQRIGTTNHLQVKTEQTLTDKLQASYLFTKSQSVSHEPQSSRVLCPNARSGCTSSVSDGELLDHCKACLFRHYHCPMNQCFWQGNYSKLYCHAEEVHGPFTGMHFGQKSRVLLGHDVMLLRHEELVFKLYAYLMRPMAMCWALQLLGPPAEAANWKYQILINKTGNSVKRLQLSDMCLHEGENVDDVLKEGRCPSAALKMLGNFLRKNRINFTLNIYNKSKSEQPKSDGVAQYEFGGMPPCHSQ